MDLAYVGIAAVLWLMVVGRFTRRAIWLVLLWIAVQGWVQLNVFNDSNATVLIYEFLLLGIYAGFAVRAMQSPAAFAVPRALWYAVPFVVWALLLVPISIQENGSLLTLIGLRTYLLPLPLVWIGYHALTTRRDLEILSSLLMIQMVLVVAVSVAQFSGLLPQPFSGNIYDVPRGYGVVGSVLRPPGTFSAPGHLGMYVLYATLFGLGLLGLSVAPVKRAVYVIGLASAVVTLMVNTQRATIVLLAIAVPLMMALAQRGRTATRLAVGIAVVVAAGAVGNQVAGDAFRTRTASIVSDVERTVIGNPMERMADALQTPVFGGGLGIASPGAARYVQGRSMGDAAAAQETKYIRFPESFMAAMVYQMGVPGLVFFYLFLAVLMHECFRAARSCRGTDMALLAAAIVCYQVAILIQSWPYDPLHTPPSRVVFWVWAGVLLRMPQIAAGVSFAGETVTAAQRRLAEAMARRRLDARVAMRRRAV